MDKNTFWQIIDEVNSQVAGDDYEGILRVTREKLLTYTPEEIADWGSIQRYYRDMADTGGVFAASCFLNDYMSDDGFIDFRMWLISRGKNVYMAALKDPDTLAGLELREDIKSAMDTRWEEYGYVADYAYEEIEPNGDIYDVMEKRPLSIVQKADIRLELEYFPHIIREDITATPLLPKLHKKYGDVHFSYGSGSDQKPGASRFNRDTAQIADQYGYRAEASSEIDAAVDIFDYEGKRICAVNKRSGIIYNSYKTLPKDTEFNEMMDEIRNTLEYFDLREREGHFDHACVMEPSIIPYFEEVARLAKRAGLSTRLDYATDEILEIQGIHSDHIASVDGYAGNMGYDRLIPSRLFDAIQDARLKIPFEKDTKREAQRQAYLQMQRDAEVQITMDNIEIHEELIIDDDHINAYVSMWFNVDNRFGTETSDTDDTVNYYADYFPEDERLECIYIIKFADGTYGDPVPVELADSERDAILTKMREAGLDELAAEINKEQNVGIDMQ